VTARFLHTRTLLLPLHSYHRAHVTLYPYAPTVVPSGTVAARSGLLLVYVRLPVGSPRLLPRTHRCYVLHPATAYRTTVYATDVCEPHTVYHCTPTTLPAPTGRGYTARAGGRCLPTRTALRFKLQHFAQHGSTPGYHTHLHSCSPSFALPGRLRWRVPARALTFYVSYTHPAYADTYHVSFPITYTHLRLRTHHTNSLYLLPYLLPGWFTWTRLPFPNPAFGLHAPHVYSYGSWLFTVSHGRPVRGVPRPFPIPVMILTRVASQRL